MTKNPKRILLIIFALLLFCSVLLVGITTSRADVGSATIIYVDDNSCPGTGNGTLYNPYCKIQTAVDNAPAESEIRVAEGTYTGVQTVTGATTYDYTQVVFIDKTLVLRGGYDASNWAAEPDPSQNKSIIDAERSGRGISIVTYSDGSVTIDGFTITGGDYTNHGNPDGEYYRGICRRTGFDCGGGLFAYNAEVDLLNSYVFNNFASGPDSGRSGDGGGVYYYETRYGSSIENTVIISNTTGPQGTGGGMSIIDSMDVTITNSVFEDNFAEDSGGGLFIAIPDMPITITSTNFYNNRSMYNGGALDASVSAGSNSLVMDRVMMADNQANQSGTTLYLRQSGVGTHSAKLSNLIITGSSSRTNNSTANVIFVVGYSGFEVHLDYITAADNQAETFAYFQTLNQEDSVVKAYLTNDLLKSFTNAFVGRERSPGTLTILYDHIHFDKVANYEVTDEGAPDFVAGTYQTGAAGLDSSYHLTSSSPAIGAGTPLSIDRDFDNDPRSDVDTDIGADEYTLKVFAPLILNK